jgi:hypothetical protein
MTQTTPKPPSANGDAEKAGDQVYEFMMDAIPYRYDEKAGEPHFLTRKEAEESSDPDVRAEAAKAPYDAPGGIMMYQVMGPAAEYGGKKKLTKEEEEDIFKHKAGEGLWWHYDGQYYRATKAMRIPYVVYQDAKGNKAVIKHIFVAFSGIDGPP